jgi:hypothetical protein
VIGSRSDRMSLAQPFKAGINSRTKSSSRERRSSLPSVVADATNYWFRNVRGLKATAKIMPTLRVEERMPSLLLLLIYYDLRFTIH